MFVRFCALAAVLAAVGCSGPLFDRSLSSRAPVLPPAQAARPSPMPSGVGDTFAFSGMLTQAQSGSATTHVAVTQRVTIAATPYPYAYEPGSVDYRTVESDRYGASVQTWHADAWHGSGAALHGVTPVLLFGSRVDDGSGDSFLFRYPSPLVADRVPEIAGAAWSNAGALNYGERDADGTTVQTSYAPAGSYLEQVRLPYECGYSAPCALDVATFPGGSARYAGSALDANGIAAIALNAPSAGWIAIVYTLTDGSQWSAGAPAWFAPQAPLYSEHDTIRPWLSLPRGCASALSFGRSGTVVVRQIARIDPAAGVSEIQETQTFATPAFGAVCVAMSDVRLSYYDFAKANFSGTPLSKTSLSEVLALTSESVPGSHDRLREGAIAAAELEHRWVGALAARPAADRVPRNPAGRAVR